MTDLAFEANLPENCTSSASNRATKYGLLGTTALCAASLVASPVSAGPKGGKVTGGDATISQSGATTTVNQKSKKATLTWSSLDVGKAETLKFNQPGTDAIALNRVLSNLPTHILGNLTANGNVWIVNPNGVAFGPNSVVDVGGLLASTKDILDSDFWADDFSFSELTGSQVEYSKITADGTIMAGKGGVVLVAPVIEASGLITTNGGNVALATARAFRVDFDGDGLLSFTVNAGAEGVLQLAESSAISATGGAVYLSAGAADAVTESVVNVGGMIDSSRVEQQGGEIVLSGGLGGEVIVTAELSAPGGEGQTGGSIDVFGDTITLAAGASLDVSGPAGGGSIRVGGDYQGGGDAPTAKSTWVTADAMLNADATVDGDGGRVIVWSDEATVFEGSLSAVGAGSGDGGFAEISGKESLQFAGYVDLSAENGEFGTLLFDPGDINIVAGDDGDDDDEVDDGTVNAGDGGNSTFEISVDALDDVNADIVLAASDDINILADLNLTQGGNQDTDFTLNAGGDIVVSETVAITTDGFIDFNATGSIILNASSSISNSDSNSNPNIDLDAGDQIILGQNASITADGALTLTADGDGNDNAAIVFGASSSITSSNEEISVTSSGGSDADNNTILMGGSFSADAPDTNDSGDGTIAFTSDDQIIFGAVLNASGNQTYSDGAITIDSDDGATFSAGLDVIFMSDPSSTASATVVGVTGSVLFDVTGASNANDIIFQDDAAFTVSGGTAEFETTTNGDIEIQQDVSIGGTSTGSLVFSSADDIQVGVSVTISTDDDISLADGITVIASDGFTLDAGDDLTFQSGGSGISISASGTIQFDAGDDIDVNNDVTVNSSASVAFNAVDITIGASDSIIADAALTLTASDDITLSQNASVSSSLASVSIVTTDVGSDDNADITLQANSDVRASTTITITSFDDIDIADNVEIHATGTVDITANADNGGNVSFLIGDGVDIRSTGGGVSLTATANDGSDDDNNNIEIDGGFTAVASSTITINSQDLVILGSSGSVDTLSFSASSGTTITGADGIEVDSGNTNSTTISVASGAISLVSTGGDVDFDREVTINASNSIDVSASGDILIEEGFSATSDDGATGTASTEKIELTAGGDVDFNPDDTGNDDFVFSAASGTFITANDVNLIGFAGSQDINITSGELTLAAKTGVDITVGATPGGFDLGDSAMGSISASQIIFITDADIDVETLSSYSATNSLRLVAGGGVTFEGDSSFVTDLDVEATGTVTVNNNDTVTMSGAGNDISITSGDIDFNGSDPAIVATGKTIILANIDGDPMVVGGSGGADDWDISDAEIGQITADAIVFETSGSIVIDSVTQGTDTTDLAFSATDNVTFSGTSSFGDVVDVTAGADAGTGSISITGATTFGDSATVTLTGFSITDDGGHIVTTAGTSDLDMVATGPGDSGTITLDSTSNVFAIPVDATANGDVTLKSGSELFIGNVAASNAIFDAPSYNTVSATVNVAGAATLFYGSADITVTDVGDPDDDIDLTNIDDGDFDFIVTGAAGVGTSGNIIVEDATWDRGISLISTAGTVTFQGDPSSFAGLVSVDSSGDITQQAGSGTLTTTGGVRFESDGNITLDNASNSFTGAISVDGGAVTLVNNGATTLGEINATGAFDLTSAGSVLSATGTSSFDVGGSTSITIDGATDATVQLVSNGTESLTFSDTVTIGVSNSGTIDDVEIDADGLLTVAALSIGGDLTLTGDVGATNTTGIAQTGAWDVTGATSLDAGTGDIIVTNTSNTFTGGLGLVGNDASATVDTSVALNNVDLTGNLVLNVDGSISQDSTGTVSVGLTSTFTPDATGTIVLDNVGNDFGVVAVTTGLSAAFSDANAIDIGSNSLSGTGSNTLVVGASGAVTQSAAITGITGEVDISSSSTVTLDNGSNDFNVLSLQADSATVSDTNALELGDVSVTNGLSITTGGTASDDLTDGAPGNSVVVGGLLTANVGAADVILDNAGNDFGSIDIAAANTTIVDSDDGLDIADLDLTGNFSLTTTDTTTGEGDVTQSGPVDVSGTTSVIADGDITLDDLANDFGGSVSLTGEVVFIATTDTLTLGTIDADDFSFSAPNFIFDGDTFNNVSGTVTFVAQPGRDFLIGEDDYIKTGTDTWGIDAASTTYLSNAQIDILEAEPTVDGVGFETSDDIYVDGLVTNLDLILNASGTVQFIDGATGTIATTTITGDLTINAGESITQFSGENNPDTFIDNFFGLGGTLGVFDPGIDFDVPDNLTANLTVTGLADLNAGDDVLLTNAGNAFSSSADAVSGSADIFSVVDVNSIALGEVTASESVSITSGGSIVIYDSISSDGSIQLTASGSIFDVTVPAESISAGTTFTALATGSVDIDQTDMSATTSVSVTAVTGYADLADITSGGTVSVITAGGTGSVTLDGVSATGAVTVTSGGAITLHNGVVQTGNNLSLTAGGTGDISDTGTGAVDVTGTTLLSAAGDSVVLDNIANDFGGAVSITAANATIVDANAFDFGASTITGPLSLTAGGAVSDSGALVVSGVNLTTINAAGQSITLNNAGTDLGGFTTGVQAASVTISETGGIWLGAIDTTGDVSVTSTGFVSEWDNSAKSIGEDFTINSGASVFIGGAVTVGAVDATGDLVVNASSTVTFNNSLDVSATTTIDSDNFNVTMANASNTFGGAVSLADVGSANIRSDSAIDFGASDVSGTLTITSAGAVSDSGAVKVSGVTSINAAGQTVEFDNSGTDFGGRVDASGTNVTLIDDVASLVLGDIDATGVLTAGAQNGGIDDGASTIAGSDINATGGASFTASTSVTLNDSFNDFGGVVSVDAGGAVSLRDANTIILGDIDTNNNTLTVVAAAAGGATAISQDSGTGISAGASSFNGSTTGDVVLTEASNSFSGAITIASANDATITGDFDLTLGGASLNPAGGSSGNLTLDVDSVSATAAINVSGNLTVSIDDGAFQSSQEVNVAGLTDINAASETVSLTNASNTFGGAVTIDASSATIAIDAGGIEFGASEITDQLTVNALGDITQSGAITGGSSMTVNVNAAGVDIDLLEASSPNDFSYFEIGGTTPANSLALRDAVGDIAFGTLDVSGDLSLEVVGDVDSNAAFDIGGATFIEVTGASSSVSLTNSGSTFGTDASDSLTIISTNDVTVNGASVTGDVNVDGVSVTIDIASIGGSIDASATSDVDIDGTSVGGGVDVNSSAGVSIDVDTIGGAVDVDASGTVDIDGSTFSNNVTVDTTGGVTVDVASIGGLLDVDTDGDVGVTSTTGVTDNVNVDGDNVTLEIASIGGLLDVDADGDIDVTGTSVSGAVRLDGASVTSNIDTIGGNLNVTATSNVDISGGSGTFIFGAVSIDGGANVSIDVEQIGDLGILDNLNLNVTAIGDIDVVTSYAVLGHVNASSSGDIDLSAGTGIAGDVDLDGESVTVNVGIITEELDVTATSHVDIDGTDFRDNVSVDGDNVSINVDEIAGVLDVDATGDIDVTSDRIEGVIRLVGDEVAVDVDRISSRIDVTGDDTSITSDRGVLLGQLNIDGALTLDVNNGAFVDASSSAISQTSGRTINVSGDVSLNPNGADIVLLSGNIGSIQNLGSAPVQPNTFDGTLSITDANDVLIGAKKDLNIGTLTATGSEFGIILLAPDMNITGPIDAPKVSLFGTSGSTQLGDGLSGGGGLLLSEAELLQIDASNTLLIGERGDVDIGDLSLSGSAIGQLMIFNDGNVAITGDLTSRNLNVNQSNALNVHFEGADNIYITGKLGVEDVDTMSPLGDLSLIAKNDVLIGNEFFVSLTDTSQLEGPNIEIDLARLDETLVHTVGAGPNVSSVVIGGSGNIAMQTTNGDVGAGLDLGNLTITQGWDGGAPEFVNLFGTVVLGSGPGSKVDGVGAAAAVGLDGIGINPDYEFNGCIIGGSFLQCTAFGTITTTIPVDQSLYLDLDIEPDEEEDDDPFTNRGNEEEWR